MIESTYLNEIATKIETDVDNILVNDSIVVSEFELEQVTDNVYEVKFTVLADDTTLIENIKLRKAGNSVISDNDVNIVVDTFEMSIRQNITISEVV